MAIRKIFIPSAKGKKYVKEYEVEFPWDFGNSIKNTEESIRRMHAEAERRYGLKNLFEVSGASIMPLGRLLSAFQLPISVGDIRTTVECAYQGSKVFENGGPYQDLYRIQSRRAKKDPRLKDSGELIGFQLGEEKFPSEPKEAFYNMIYISALQKFLDISNISNRRFKNHFYNSGGFTDIYFNPNKSINCQARSVALFIALHKRNLIDLTQDFQPYNIITGV